MFFCDEPAYYELPCDEWAYTQIQSNITAGHVQRGGMSSLGAAVALTAVARHDVQLLGTSRRHLHSLQN